MTHLIEQISGNSFNVRLSPESPGDEKLLQTIGDNSAIEQYYKHAIKQEFPTNIKIASLTPNDDFPYSATIEKFSISGSV
ncbi:MAG TPA: hypothetical protein VIM89_03950 [Mucilaginibacter sp.]